MTQTIGRRSLLRAGVVGAAGLGFSSLFPAWAQTGSMGQMPTLSGEDIHLKIANTPFTVGGRNGLAVTMNAVLPAPLIRLREGPNVRLHRVEERCVGKEGVSTCRSRCWPYH